MSHVPTEARALLLLLWLLPLATLTVAAAEGFLGACSLLQPMQSYQLYEDAALYVQERQPPVSASVINSSVISAVRGQYGDYHLTPKTVGSTLWISPLMALYWFFDLEAVAGRHLLLSHLRQTQTERDAYLAIHAGRRSMSIRPQAQIPL